MAKTALDLTDEEMIAYKLGTKLKKWQMEERWNQAYKIAQTAAKLLKEDFKARRVVVFGSLAHGDRFSPWSDIDIAAWDIPSEYFYKAVVAVTGLSHDFHIDLVDPKDCKPSVRHAIEENGIEI